MRPKPPKDEEGISTIIAQVGDRKITDKELMEHVVRIQEKTPMVISTYEQKKELLDELINLELLYQEALKQGVDKTFSFKARLAETLIEDLSFRARRKVTEERMLEFYQRNAKFIDQVRARHILLRTKKSDSEDKKRARRKELEELRAKILENPASFPEFAKQYSEDGTNAKGGDLGFFNYAHMLPEFSEVAFSLKKIGDVSEIVETKHGYHIIQLADERRGLQNHRKDIQEFMLRESQIQAFHNEVERLRKKPEITIYKEALLNLSPLPKVILTDPDKILPKDLDPSGE
jgi:peptidyl-prolyl cis-trans isomerase C